MYYKPRQESPRIREYALMKLFEYYILLTIIDVASETCKNSDDVYANILFTKARCLKLRDHD